MQQDEARTYTGRFHPSTSHQAAHSLAESAANLRERVFAAIERAGDDGLTAEEIEGLTRLGGNTVRPRLCELREAKRIVQTDRTRKTRSGRNAHIYVIEIPDLTPRDRHGVPVLDLDF